MSQNMKLTLGISIPISSIFVSSIVLAAPNDLHYYLKRNSFHSALNSAKTHTLNREQYFNDLDYNGKSPLIVAAEVGATEFAEYLVECGAKLNVRDNDGNSALMYATRSKNYKLVKKLVSHGAKVDLRNNAGNTALMWSVKETWNPNLSEELNIFERLLNADIYKNIGEHNTLYDFVNHTNSEGNTALMWAARSGNNLAMERLIQFKADVNIANIHGRTALMWTAEQGHTEGVRILLSANARVDQISRSGKTAIDYVRSSSMHKDKIIRLLRGGYESPSSEKPQGKCSQPVIQGMADAQAEAQIRGQAEALTQAQAMVKAQAKATAQAQAPIQVQTPTVEQSRAQAAPVSLTKSDKTEVSFKLENSGEVEVVNLREWLREKLHGRHHHDENEVVPN